jgi:hypothetical protein
MVFCSYTLLLMNNLDLFTNFYYRYPSRWASWAEDCQSSWSVEKTQPPLYQELITGADGPFCTGGREFREAPAFSRRKGSLHLKGFHIDTIGAEHDTAEDQANQAQLDHTGYGKFMRGRQWYETAGGLAVLGPQEAPVGAVLTILIGGKTPYLLGKVRKKACHFRLVGEWYVNSQSFRDTRHKAAN